MNKTICVRDLDANDPEPKTKDDCVVCGYWMKDKSYTGCGFLNAEGKRGLQESEGSKK